MVLELNKLFFRYYMNSIEYIASIGNAFGVSSIIPNIPICSYQIQQFQLPVLRLDNKLFFMNIGYR